MICAQHLVFVHLDHSSAAGSQALGGKKKDSVLLGNWFMYVFVCVWRVGVGVIGGDDDDDL